MMVEIFGSFGAAHGQTNRHDLNALGIALLVVGAGSLGFRYTSPLITLAVAAASVDLYIGLGYPFGPVFLSLVIATFSAVQRGDRRKTRVIAVIGYVGFFVASLFDPHGGPSLWLRLLLVAGWVSAVLGISEVVRARTEQFRLRRETEQSEQRLRIAQELHDVLAHNISLINVQASVALHLLDEQPEQARPALANIKQASHDALGELRSALDLLRNGSATPYSPAPTLDDINALIDGVRVSGLHIEYELVPAPYAVPQNVQVTLFRVVQEALTNITRHAHAQRAHISISFDATGATIDVADDGIGGAAIPGNGTTGMRERVESLGGTLEIGPKPEGGFRVHAHIPEVNR